MDWYELLKILSCQNDRRLAEHMSEDVDDRVDLYFIKENSEEVISNVWQLKCVYVVDEHSIVDNCFCVFERGWDLEDHFVDIGFKDVDHGLLVTEVLHQVGQQLPHVVVEWMDRDYDESLWHPDLLCGWLLPTILDNRLSLFIDGAEFCTD